MLTDIALAALMLAQQPGIFPAYYGFLGRLR